MRAPFRLFRPVHWPRLVLWIACCVLAAGCVGRGPSRPDFDPAASGAEAVRLYDKNGDGRIAGEELDACPALKMATGRADQDSDGGLTAGEIADRIRYFQNANTTILNGSVEVTLDGRPLEGATVTFEPEPFLGDYFKPCSGETDANGRASMEGQDAKFPGLYLGFYRVRVSKDVDGKETIPAHYNTESQLGYEATDDIPEVSNIIQFELTSGGVHEGA